MSAACDKRESSVDNEDNMCRICLNNSYESDTSKLDKKLIVDIDNKMDSLAKLVQPCRCSGSIGNIHIGCLLLETQFRKSTECDLCKTEFKFVKWVFVYIDNRIEPNQTYQTSIVNKLFTNRIERISTNNLTNYIKNNLIRFFISVVCLLLIPVSTVLWFINKIKFTIEEDQPWIMEYRKKTRYCLNTNNSNVRCRVVQKLMSNNVHPLIRLIFAYHWDVLWINLINLLLVQVLIINVNHYQDWVLDNRPKMSIQLNI